MRKGKDIIGKPIVALATGERISSVHDLVFDHEAAKLLALLVDEGGWFRAARVVPISAVESFGDDAVVIDSPDSVVAANTLERVSDILGDDATLIGTTLMTTDGKNLGRLADMYFDEASGNVVGYEVTGGLFSDMSSGRSFVPAEGQLNLGKDAAFVPPETARAMEEQAPGGLQGALSSAGQNLSEAYSGVAENVKTTAGNLAQETRERQKAFVVGKTAGSDVTAQDGTLIVAKGEPITAETALFAEDNGALGSLFAAAGGGALQETFASARDRVQSGYDDLSTAGKERQKEFVTGKTAGNDVTAPDGTIIVTRGDTIMPEMVDFAEQKGALPRLLAAAGGGSVQQGYASVRDRVQSGFQNLASGTSQDVLGRPAEAAVIAPDGTLIVAQHQVITDSEVERAKAHGALDALIAAANLSSMNAAGPSLSERVQSGLGTVQERLQSGVDSVRERVSGAPSVSSAQDAIGRRVQRDVAGPAGSLIAAQGQIVTQSVVDNARLHGREGDLLAAVGRPGAASSAGAAVSDAGDRLAAGAQTVKEGASNFLDRAREWLGETRDRAEEANEERRIQGAVGRPVTRVILDQQDNVILNVNEIITHKAVEMARAGGVLPILLDSVSTETQAVTPEDVKPHITGTAALPGDHDEPVRLNEDGTPANPDGRL